jgi:3-phenylpropionate/cinnamic acid dioxygenase small subunit
MDHPERYMDAIRVIEAFLYREARLLEDNQFDDWLACFSDEVQYSMPVRQNVESSGSSNQSFDTFALYDDDKESLRLRVLRIQTGEAHAEVPPSVTQRFITNIWAEPESASTFNVHSNFMVYQERRGLHGVTFYGRRTDLMSRDDDHLRIERRKIELAQTILPSTISIFF